MAGLGKKTFTAGEVLTASDVNGYLMEQSVMVFGGTAARSSAIPTPSEGMISYRTDDNAIEFYDGTSWAPETTPFPNSQAGTAYTFVATDAGKLVSSNNASAVTFTIPPQSSVAWPANTVLTVMNYGAGALSIAGGSGVTVTNSSATVAQYSSATVVRTGSDAWTVVPAGSPSGLTLISRNVVTTQSTVDFTNCFSSTYDNYKILFEATAASTTLNIDFRLLNGSTPVTTDYFWGLTGWTTSGTAANSAGSAGSGFILCQMETSPAENVGFSLEVMSPNLAKRTRFFIIASNAATSFIGRSGAGVQTNPNAYNGFRMITSTGTFSGVVTIYGYQRA